MKNALFVLAVILLTAVFIVASTNELKAAPPSFDEMVCLFEVEQEIDFSTDRYDGPDACALLASDIMYATLISCGFTPDKEWVQERVCPSEQPQHEASTTPTYKVEFTNQREGK